MTYVKSFVVVLIVVVAAMLAEVSVANEKPR